MDYKAGTSLVMDAFNENYQKMNDKTPDAQLEHATTNTPGSPTEDEKRFQIAPWKLGLLMLGNALAVFCVALDNTIISNAIPEITRNFDSLQDLGWYSSIYFFTNCSVVLLFGKIYTYYSMKWTFIVALGFFEVGSVICGAAPSSVALIVGRAIAGLGAGGVLPGAILIISESVPLQRRPLFTGILGGMGGIASVVGPFLLIFFPAIFCLLLGLQWGGAKYNWGNARIIVLFVVFGLATASWIAIQFYKKEQASVPPRIIGNRNVWSSAWYMVCIMGSFIVVLYYFPIWFQAVKGASPMKSGIMILPIIVGLIVCMTLGSIFVSVIGYYHPIMVAGMIVSTVGAGLCTTLEVESGSGKWIGYQAMCGLGLGLGFQLPFIAVQTALPRSDIPVATAVITFAQNLSSAVIVAIGQTVFQNRLLVHVAQFAPTVDPNAVVHSGAAGLDKLFPSNVLPQIVRAYNAAVTETFYVATAIAALSIFGLIRLEQLSVRKNGGDENVADALSENSKQGSV
ncbi:MFS general substrate transporter [Penicillium bovifimosum]|uniref:MFS general substrate transporter n=1 Tax=Penicillium bovifimosum TaxID=126998 RepID=A0A9W9L1I2_9EURO|nr:MFS general substrate transporter [Penicillium bovifimosum]KAJ5130682.1 MFS general substrate transporter [Penicillium bovifimosum]